MPVKTEEERLEDPSSQITNGGGKTGGGEGREGVAVAGHRKSKVE